MGRLNLNGRLTTAVYILEYDYSRLNSDLNGQEVLLANPVDLTFPVDLPSGLKTMTAPLAQWMRMPGTFPIAEPVEFNGFFPTLLETDWPESRGSLPLFRRCMIDALRSAGDFAHRIIAARITDDVASEGCPADYPVGRTTDDYALLHLTKHLDVLDLERSDHEDYDPETQRVLWVGTPYLISPPGGFPPAFRLAKFPTVMLISEAGRQALLDAQIRGISFEPFWEG